MGKSGPTPGKRQREADKAAKAKAKRERRQQPKAEEDGTVMAAPTGQPSALVLERLADLHRQFEAAEIGFDAYDEAKEALLRQLTVD